MLNGWKLCKYNEFNITDIPSVKVGKKKRIANTIVCLDTETSHNHNEENPIGWIYQWCFSFMGQLVYGRTPHQFIEALDKLANISRDSIVIYVHNLSYDIQYLKNFLIERYGDDYNILANEPHKIISFSIGRFIFKCSYFLSNKSLSKWSNDLNVKHKKLVGSIDYQLIRNQNSKLNKKDWKYMFYDVICLHECIQKTLEHENDSLATIPLTSTGYVRRDGLKFSQSNKKWWTKFRETALDIDTYTACKKAFAGALTHGNMYYANTTMNGIIKHFDFTSHYPTQQRCKDFPIGKFNRIGNNLTLGQLRKYLKTRCLLINITFENIELKNRKITLPYLQESKAKEFSQNAHFICDNGRVLKSTGLITLWVTELDLDILLKQYKYTAYNINICYGAIKGKLPDWFIDFVDKFYKEKSDFKYLAKHEKDEKKKEDAEMSLMKSKNRLNGIYGLSATDIVRAIIEMSVDGEWTKERPTNIDEILDKYYNSRNHYLPMQWGTWTTAHARHELVELVEIIGYDNYLYCDTDSCFFLDDEAGTIEKRIVEWNKKKREEAELEHFYITNDIGEKVYYHYFEKEKEDIIKFRFLHAKCYAYVTKDSNEETKEIEENLHIVVAGVSKKGHGTTREKELGNIDNLKEDFVFRKCGGTMSKYVESEIFIDVNRNVCASSCIISDNTKTLSSNIEYQLESYLVALGE